MSAFQLDQDQFVHAYQGLRQQLVVLDHQLAALKAKAAAAGDTGDSGVFRGVGQARGTAAVRAKNAQAEVERLRNEVSMFLHNAHAAFVAYGQDAQHHAAAFKALDSGLTGQAGQKMSEEAKAEDSKAHPKAPKGHPSSAPDGGSVDTKVFGG